VGLPLDAANHLPEGPACVLVRASDFAGNHMVSFPLHVCVDLGQGTGKCTGFVPDKTACTGVLANGSVSPTSKCIEPTAATNAAPNPNPGTFHTDGLEIRDLDLFK